MRPRPVRSLRLWPALLLCVLGGVLNAMAYPHLGLWPLAFVGTGAILWSLAGRRVWGSLLVGFAGGLAFYGVLVYWSTVYLGPVPWIALSVFEAVFFAVGSMLISLAWRFVPRLSRRFAWRMLGVPLVLAGLWTLREAVAAVWPWGGFSWGRLAFSQADSPFGGLVAWIGISGLSFVMAWVSAVIVQAFSQWRLSWTSRGLTAAIAAFAVAAIPAFPVATSGSVRVAAVQGNSDSGLFARIKPGDSLIDHLDATEPIFGKKVDVVIWPENASDIDPQVDSEAANVLDYVSESMKAPLVTGTITANAKGQTFNSVLLWRAGKGTVDQYDKIHPVPFAEYLPARSFFYPLAPSLFDLVPRDYSFGTRNNVFTIDHVVAGVAICFDIVDDQLVQQMVDSGAQYIIAPTNNADFGHTDEGQQQVAIAKLRAIETGRSLVNASTVGVSAIFAPDGTQLDALPRFRPGAMVQTIPLSSTTTPATVDSRIVEWLVSGLGLGWLLVGLLLHPRNRKARRRG